MKGKVEGDFLCDGCDFEVGSKENEEDLKIVKQVSLDATLVVKQDTCKCVYCRKAFCGGNSLRNHIRFSHVLLRSHCSGGVSLKWVAESHTIGAYFGCVPC